MFRIVCDPSSGSTVLCLTEITLSGSQIFFVSLVGVWQRNLNLRCVCTVRRAGSQPVVPCTQILCTYDTFCILMLILLRYVE